MTTSTSKAVSTGNGIEEFTITPGQARRGLVKDVDAMTAWIRHRKGETDREVGALMWTAALGTHALFVAATTTENPTPKAPNGFAKQGDYAEAIGFSNGYVTKLRNLGRAAAVHGVTKASGDWGFLVANVGNAKVSEAIKSDDTAAFRKALKTFRAQVAEHGRIIGDSKPPTGEILSGGPTPEGQSTPSDGTSGDAPVVTIDPLAALDAALDAVEAAAKAATDRMTAERWSGYEDRLDAVKTRMVTILTDRAKKSKVGAERDRKPTPATVAKAAAKVKPTPLGHNAAKAAKAETVKGEVVESKTA